MESSTRPAGFEPGWKTYFRSVIALLPALVCWGFATVLIMPKFQQIWVDAGVAVYSAQWLMNGLIAFTQHGGLFIGGLFVVLVIPEWCLPNWPRYRRAALGAGCFLANTAVLFYLLGMCTAGAIAGPALGHR